MAGYTEITVKGSKTGLRFGLPAIRRISEKINLLAGSEEITLNIMSMVHILYSGYLNACLANDEEPVLKVRDFYDLVEEAALNNDLSEVKRVMEVFAGSKEVKEIVKAGDVKKKTRRKLSGTISSSSVLGKEGITVG